jgi:hypothetical protein
VVDDAQVAVGGALREEGAVAEVEDRVDGVGVVDEVVGDARGLRGAGLLGDGVMIEEIALEEAAA